MTIRKLLNDSRYLENFDIRTPRLLGQDEVSDNFYINRVLISDKSRSKLINFNKPLYGFVMSEAVAVPIKELTNTGLKYPMFSRTIVDSAAVVYKVKVWFPITKRGGFVTDLSELTNSTTGYNPSTAFLRDAYLDPMKFGYGNTVEKNSLIKVVLDDQRETLALVIGYSEKPTSFYNWLTDIYPPAPPSAPTETSSGPRSRSDRRVINENYTVVQGPLVRDSNLVNTLIPASHIYSREGTEITNIVIHSTEGPEVGSDRRGNGTTDMFSNRNRTKPTAAHYVVEPYEITQMAREKDLIRHCGGSGNWFTIGIEMVGSAYQTRAEWLDQWSRPMIIKTAQLTADICKRQSIPPVHLTDDQLRNEQKGIVSHRQIRDVYRGTTHWDPGPNFPWDVFMAEVTRYYGTL